MTRVRCRANWAEPHTCTSKYHRAQAYRMHLNMETDKSPGHQVDTARKESNHRGVLKEFTRKESNHRVGVLEITYLNHPTCNRFAGRVA